MTDAAVNPPIQSGYTLPRTNTLESGEVRLLLAPGGAAGGDTGAASALVFGADQPGHTPTEDRRRSSAGASSSSESGRRDSSSSGDRSTSRERRRRRRSSSSRSVSTDSSRGVREHLSSRERHPSRGVNHYDRVERHQQQPSHHRRRDDRRDDSYDGGYDSRGQQGGRRDYRAGRDGRISRSPGRGDPSRGSRGDYDDGRRRRSRSRSRDRGRGSSRDGDRGRDGERSERDRARSSRPWQRRERSRSRSRPASRGQPQQEPYRNGQPWDGWARGSAPLHAAREEREGRRSSSPSDAGARPVQAAAERAAAGAEAASPAPAAAMERRVPSAATNTTDAGGGGGGGTAARALTPQVDSDSRPQGLSPSTHTGGVGGVGVGGTHTPPRAAAAGGSGIAAAVAAGAAAAAAAAAATARAASAHLRGGGVAAEPLAGGAHHPRLPLSPTGNIGGGGCVDSGSDMDLDQEPGPTKAYYHHHHHHHHQQQQQQWFASPHKQLPPHTRTPLPPGPPPPPLQQRQLGFYTVPNLPGILARDDTYTLPLVSPEALAVPPLLQHGPAARLPAAGLGQPYQPSGGGDPFSDPYPAYGGGGGGGGAAGGDGFIASSSTAAPLQPAFHYNHLAEVHRESAHAGPRPPPKDACVGPDVPIDTSRTPDLLSFVGLKMLQYSSSFELQYSAGGPGGGVPAGAAAVPGGSPRSLGRQQIQHLLDEGKTLKHRGDKICEHVGRWTAPALLTSIAGALKFMEAAAAYERPGDRPQAHSHQSAASAAKLLDQVAVLLDTVAHHAGAAKKQVAKPPPPPPPPAGPGVSTPQKQQQQLQQQQQQQQQVLDPEAAAGLGHVLQAVRLLAARLAAVCRTKWLLLNMETVKRVQAGLKPIHVSSGGGGGGRVSSHGGGGGGGRASSHGGGGRTALDASGGGGDKAADGSSSRDRLPAGGGGGATATEEAAASKADSASSTLEVAGLSAGHDLAAHVSAALELVSMWSKVPQAWARCAAETHSYLGASGLDHRGQAVGAQLLALGYEGGMWDLLGTIGLADRVAHGIRQMPYFG